MVQKQIIGDAVLYCGDALEILATLEKNSIDCLCTDPPYSSGGMTIGARQMTSNSKYVGNNATHNIDFYGDNRDGRSWAFWSMCWLAQCWPLLRDGAYAQVFTDWRQLPLLTDAFQGGGMTWRGIVPWNKTQSSRAPHTGYFRHQCEYVVWGSKGKLGKCEHAGPFPGFITQRVIPSEKQHMTGKPVSLMTDLIKPVPVGGAILDPFMGSGSTGVAALQTGRKFIGIEMSEHYFDIACRRLEKSVEEGRAAPSATIEKS
ncbi:site-specific DNA-methyltransferase [Salmonella enterica]|nr:site-specific DNA-methyltransferase [Salmonella enterica]EKS4862824.1 site-specific DNA-methyltransferase [Salmonella enterica]EKS4880537.1 site-specific DNA-methyltransferase [Salmonella enterica]EKS4884996.1 site-specific DNA-methyltransferase [Salmonella enterica]EKS5974652.1 site-specific DNA-methyltransferase [Salmonella enterica]